MFTEKQLQQKKKGGRIRGYRWPEKQKQILPTFQNRSKEKEWIEANLQYFCNKNKVTLETEYKFSYDRKFRADWAIPAFKILVEYEGLISEKSRHLTFKGYSADTEKYSLASLEGWAILRYTVLNYRNLLEDLNKIKV